MTTKDIIVMLLLYLPFVLGVLISLWKLDERVLRLEELVKCLESETRALRRKIALKESENNGTDSMTEAKEAWNRRAETKDEAWVCQGNIGG